MAAMHQPENSQWTQSFGKVQLRRVSDFYINGQSHHEEGQAIEEVDEDDVTNEEIGLEIQEAASWISGSFFWRASLDPINHELELLRCQLSEVGLGAALLRNQQALCRITGYDYRAV
jgi:hypothetical protein